MVSYSHGEDTPEMKEVETMYTIYECYIYDDNTHERCESMRHVSKEELTEMLNRYSSMEGYGDYWWLEAEEEG